MRARTGDDKGQLSEPEDEVLEELAAGAGAAAADAGAEPPSALAAGAAASPPLAAGAASPVLAAGGLGEEYRSLYHPAPLNWIAGAVMVRPKTPPQCGQVVSSGSENFWIFSVRRWHC